MAHFEYAAAAADLRERTGVIVPTYQPKGVQDDAFVFMLRETVESFLRETARPEAICLSVDGDGPAGEHARRLSAETGVRAVVGEVSRGKLSALRNGMAALSAWTKLSRSRLGGNAISLSGGTLQ